MMLMRSQHVSRSRQKGGIAALTGLTILVLVGMLGLVLDLGHLYIAKSELQNAADACALAAARELSSFNASTMDRATRAGIAAGTANKVNLQATPADIRDADITFGADLAVDADGRLLHFERKVTEDTTYARCAPHETSRLSVAMWVMQVFGYVNQDMYAHAVAKQVPVQAACGVPIAACTDDAAAPNMGFTVGNWYSGRFAPGDAAAPGEYGWVQFRDEQGAGSDELSEFLHGEGLCNYQSKTVVFRNTGLKEGAVKAWNSRFGLYANSYRNKQTEKIPGVPNSTESSYMEIFPPDRSGYAYQFKDGTGRYADYKAKTESAVGTPFNMNDFLNDKGKVQTYPGGADAPIALSDYTKYGEPHRREVAMPVIRCGDWNAGLKEFEVVGWACSLMVAPMVNEGQDHLLEFIGQCANASADGYPKLVR